MTCNAIDNPHPEFQTSPDFAWRFGLRFCPTILGFWNI